jgi:hypothetical protein
MSGHGTTDRHADVIWQLPTVGPAARHKSRGSRCLRVPLVSLCLLTWNPAMRHPGVASKALLFAGKIILKPAVQCELTVACNRPQNTTGLSHPDIWFCSPMKKMVRKLEVFRQPFSKTLAVAPAHSPVAHGPPPTSTLPYTNTGRTGRIKSNIQIVFRLTALRICRGFGYTWCVAVQAAL